MYTVRGTRTCTLVVSCANYPKPSRGHVDIVVRWSVCLFVVYSESAHLAATALRLQPLHNKL